MNNKELEIFVAVYHTSNITQAAKSLFSTPQGISKTIKRLEAELDCTLFSRSANKLTATKSADILYQYADRILSDYSALKAAIHSGQALTGERLRVVFATGILTYLTTDYLDDFNREFSEIDLDYQEYMDDDIYAKLDMRLADLAVQTGPVDLTKYDAVHFTRHQRVALINKNHPLAQKSLLTFQDLDGETLIILGPRFQSYNEHLNLLIQNGASAAAIYPTYDPTTMSDGTKAGTSIGLLVDFSALLLQRENIVLKQFSPPLYLDTYFITPKGSIPSHAIKESIRFSLLWHYKHSEHLKHLT